MMNNSALATLEARFRRAAALGDAAGVLGWDRNVMMPEGGADARAEQMAVLGVMIHELMIAPDLTELLEAAEQEVGEDHWKRANLNEMRRKVALSSAFPSTLVEAISRASSKSEALWREARASADFSIVADALDEVVKLTREEADLKAEALGTTPYQALLWGYEPGGSVEVIESLFKELEAELPPLLEAVLERQRAAGLPADPSGPFPIPAQRSLARELMETVGFDFDHGRLDETLHPFCGGVPDDVRVTTRYDENGFVSGVMGVLHETGHALYERGLPKQWRGQPVGEARGMVLHESQSLLMEMQACRSPEFLKVLSDKCKAAFDVSGPDWTPQNLQKIYSRAKRGFIRVDADEITYPLHVILRTRLERALLSGELQVKDLPGAWNAGMEELLGVTPPNDALGCLQDIHWYDGAIGYFPTYTLGAMAAAQIFQAALSAESSIPEAIEQGDFSVLMGWLRTNIHEKASSASTDEILAEATGNPLKSEPFLSHLKRRYLEN